MEKVKELLTSEKPLKWLFSGDSITHGAFHTFGKRDYTEHFTERVRFELGRKLDIVINTAISGTDTNSPLKHFDTLIGQFKPDLVFLMFGMNDCESEKVPIENFKDNIYKLIDKCANVKASLILQTTCPILPNSCPEREAHIGRYMDAIRDMAHSKKLPLIDHDLFWREHSSAHYYWMSNSFHPNAFGHRALAHLIFKELGILDETASNICRFFVPGLSK